MKTMLPLLELFASVSNVFECGDSRTKSELRHYYIQADVAINKFRYALDECMVSIKNDDVLRRYIRHCQQRIEKMLDILSVSHMESLEAPPVRNHKTCSDMKQDICLRLLKLLGHMHTNFYAHFAHDSIVPVLYAEYIRKNLEPSCIFIHTWLQYAEPDVIPMKEMILDMFKELQPGDSNFLTYRQLDYINFFIDAMVIWKGGQEITADRLRRFLLSFNFNIPRFYHYMQGHINATLSSCGDDVDRWLTIGNILSDLEKQYVMEGIAFDKNSKPVIKMLTEWLANEAREEMDWLYLKKILLRILLLLKKLVIY